MRKRFLLLLLTILLVNGAVAQAIVRNLHYTSLNGMLSDVTYSGMFDRNNYLWICTDRGLSRFDGTDFTHFTIAEGLPDDDVIWVTEDDNGTIWAQPFQREVAFLEKNSSVFRNITTLIPKDTVTKDVTYRVFKLRHGRVALLSVQNSVIRIVGNGKWLDSYFMPPRTLSWGGGVYENAKGQLVAISTGRTFVINRDRTVEKRLDYFRYTWLNVFHETFVFNDAAHRSLTFLDTRTDSTWTIFPGLAPHRIGLFRNGVFTSDIGRSTTFTSFATHRSQPDTLKALLSFAAENKDGTAQAFFTADQGFYLRTFVQPDNYVYLNETPYYLFLDQQQPKVADGRGKTLYPVGSVNGQMDIDLTTIPVFAEVFGDTTIIYNADFPVLLKGKRMALTQLTGTVKDVCIVNDSLRYLAVTYGMSVFNKRTLEQRKLFEGRCTCVSNGPNGSVFMGSHWGLKELRKDGTLRDWTLEKRFPYVRITDMVYRNGVVWVATAGKGLLAVCNGKVTAVANACNDASRNVITAIEGDANGHLFVGYYNGAEKLTYVLRNDRPVIREREILKTFRSEGIRSFFLWKGLFYALGNRGVFLLDPQKREQERQFRFRITRVAIDDQLKDVTGHYILQPGEHDFLLSFSTINFEQFPLQYRYRINGREWTYTREPEIHYKNLSPGTYRMTIQVLNNYYRPSDTKVILFEILPPFFQRAVFVIPAVLVLLFVLFLLIRYWILRAYRKERSALLQEHKLNELELIALKAQINPHFVFNCLNSIKGLIYEDELDAADRYIDRFAELFRQTLEASSSSWHSVSSEIAYLRTYLEMEQVSVKGRFRFCIEALPPLNVDTVQVPPMLLQPYVENAIKHGVMRLRDRSGEIRIVFEQAGAELICTVTDNGVGREATAAKHTQRTSKGISITTKRAQLYGITTTISDRPGGGTIVRLTVVPETAAKTNIL